LILLEKRDFSYSQSVEFFPAGRLFYMVLILVTLAEELK